MNALTLSALLFILTISYQGFAQNIVKDPGLEDTLKCPYTVGRFYSPTNPGQRYIADWRATTRASPDLHNICGYNNYAPHTGEGYAGIILWDPAETREYISAEFTSPMIAGECYAVELFVALKDNSTRTIEEFQFSFSNADPVNTAWPPPAPLNVPVHHQLSTPVTSNTWEKRTFLYEASGGENWVTIGNFVDNNSTTVSQVSNIGSVSAYYYIDDITITKLDLGPDLVLCPGDLNEVISNITCPSFQYLWSNGDTDTVTSVSTPGTLTLTISGDGNCNATDEVIISLPSGSGIDAGTDVTINSGETTSLSVTGTSNPTWAPPSSLSCSNCISPDAAPDSTQLYVVSGQDINGCFVTDSITVFVIQDSNDPPNDSGAPTPIDPEPEVEEVYFYLPNSFTPDGDEYNNSFHVVGGTFSNFNLTVWNRWGSLVFESNDPNIAWDGSFDGKMVQAGTYVYKLVVTTTTNVTSEWIGHVNLIR